MKVRSSYKDFNTFRNGFWHLSGLECELMESENSNRARWASQPWRIFFANFILKKNYLLVSVFPLRLIDKVAAEYLENVNFCIKFFV